MVCNLNHVGQKTLLRKIVQATPASDRVPPENFYRRLRQTVGLHWLYNSTKKYYGSEGQQSIDPVVFFKLILIGYPLFLLF